MKARRRIVIGIIVAIGLLLITIPVFAIGNPTTIWFGTKSPTRYAVVFENVDETGDMLFLAEGFVDYASPPTDYDADEAFVLQVRSTDNATVLLSRPLESYGERPISIYQTAAQVLSANLTSGSFYVMRISGNPLIFPSLVEGTNMTSKTLSADDWYDQSTSTELANLLKIACVYIAENMEEEDSVTTYLAESEGVQYLTPTGANLFLTGIPSLNVFCPSLFQITTEVMTAEDPAATGNYTANITALARLGPTIDRGVTNIGVWLDVSKPTAAGLILMALMVMLCVWLYKRTQSGKVVLGIGIAATLPVGTFLGLAPMVLLFIIAIFIVLMTGYYFLTRGAL